MKYMLFIYPNPTVQLSADERAGTPAAVSAWVAETEERRVQTARGQLRRLGVVMIIHVLAYLARTLGLGPADWRPNAEPIVAGVRSRRAALGGALRAGVIVASVSYPAQRAWLSHRREHRHDDRRGEGST